MKLTRQATVLLVDDVARSIEYYRDALGFEVERFEANPDHYGYARRDGCEIHFACFRGARPRPNSETVPPDMFDVYFGVDDVEALHRGAPATRRRAGAWAGRPGLRPARAPCPRPRGLHPRVRPGPRLTLSWREPRPAARAAGRG